MTQRKPVTSSAKPPQPAAKTPAAKRPARKTTPKTKTSPSAAKVVVAKKNKTAKKPAKKEKKEKVIRDSFTMPAADYASIATLKKKCLSLGVGIKRSELLRAGLIALQSLSDTDLIKTVGKVESIKTGRPASEKKKAKDGHK